MRQLSKEKRTMESCLESSSKSFHDVVRERHSVRKFLPQAVPDALLRKVVAEAQLSPSNCNTQPWQVHIASGATRDLLSQAIRAAEAAGEYSPDFSFSIDDYPGLFNQRARDQGAAYYKAIGIAREAVVDRQTAARHNLDFFGAPHVALLFMPPVGDNVRVAGDIGMYAQTFLLSLVANGLGGIPQTMLGSYAETIRKVLGIDNSLKMLFGISFGYPDMTAAANHYRIDRGPIEGNVTFHA
jgi:nitroreductase